MRDKNNTDVATVGSNYVCSENTLKMCSKTKQVKFYFQRMKMENILKLLM